MKKDNIPIYIKEERINAKRERLVILSTVPLGTEQISFLGRETIGMSGP